VSGDQDVDGTIDLRPDSLPSSPVAVELEARLRAGVAWFRSLVQHAPDLLAVVDRDGLVTYVSPSVERIIGYAPAELLGTRFGALVPEEHRGVIDRITAAVADRPGVPVRIEARVRHRDGSLRLVEGSVTNLLGDDAVRGMVVNLRDETERRAVEAARRRSEAALRAIVQASPLAIIAFDARRVVHVWSSACHEMFGWSADDAIGRRPRFVVDDAGFDDLLTRVFGGESITGYETCFGRADGRIMQATVAVAPLRNAAGRVVTAVAVIADVTERVEAEAAIRASEERLRALVASASDVISVVDRSGALRYSSPVAETMFGYRPGERQGENIFDLVHPDDRPRVMELFAMAREIRGMFRPIEVRIQRADGSWMHAEVVANNLLDEPAVEGIVVTTRDITERKASEEALRASEARVRERDARYRAVVDDQTELVCRYLPDTTLTFVNRAFAEFHGRGPDDLIGARLVDLVAPAERDAHLARLRDFGSGDDVRQREDWSVAADGSLRWYQWTDRAFVDEQGVVREFQSVGRDVTERRRSTTLTTRQAEILEGVARGVPLEQTLRAIASTVEDHFPRVQCRISLLDADAGGVAAEPASGPVWSTPILGSDGHSVLGTLDVAGRDVGGPGKEDEQIFSLLAHLAAIAIERKAFEDRLAHQSLHDPLTGLPNRLLLLDRVGLAIARCRRVNTEIAVLFLDLDRFKNVNDSVGHDAGDELLIAAARRLESLLRPGDTVARFGGDEFAILCEDLPVEASRERALEIANRLLASIAQPFVVRGAETFVSASVGIALARGDERPDELLRDADAAMYDAKEAGRGRVAVFDDTMRTRALDRHTTGNALHRAIERGELRLFFQPVVCLREARCVGAEALVRWQHPERGLLAPADFVPVAEETGLVVALGEWVLEHAAREAAQWQIEHDQPFLVSVNISARQLAQPELEASIAGVLARSGVDPANLCLEITESVLMDDADAAIRMIEAVRRLGVRLHIDDFGTGYSSLGYLKRFPVDGVKIDRSFVDGLGVDPGDAAIVSAVIGLAHALDLHVVAEGVEREDQLRELVRLGCDGGQGYFFAPPQPAADLRQLIGHNRTWRPPGHRLMRT